MLTVPRYYAWAVLFFGLLSASVPGAETLSGEQIYKKQCAWCHGASGEGHPKRYRNPLVGSKSIDQLAKLIDKTMPEDNPEKCVGEDARKVAVFIYGAFYSPAAQVRNKPPRIELSRLTVRQYQNAVADLISTFRTPVKPDDRQGLRGEYFTGRGFRGNQSRLIDRIDPEVRFDFNTNGPTDKFDASQFSIRWEGSVLAPETGTYEFVVHTEHATRFWINDLRQPLIDAWVKSGSDTEYRGVLPLLGGRAYPVRLEFSKAKQGVDDSKNGKPKPVVKASIALLWKPPHQVDTVIPARNLSPVRPPESFVLTTAFPPDDRSLGWERATAISREWDQATTEAALETATYVAARLGELAGVRDGDSQRTMRAQEFCRRLAERAFRRPLTDEQKRVFIEQQFAEVSDPEIAIKRVVLLVLKSPRFLYPEIGARSDAYDVASRLSLALWDALPDQALLDAAAAGKLSTPEQVNAQAERLLADPRAHAKLREFLLRWLKVDQVADMAKDPKRFPGFDPAVIADLRTSLELFLDEVVWDKESDFRRLLQDDKVYLNGRLAKFYNVDLPADAAFQKVALDAERRAGVLTHPYLMTNFAYTASTSPIHRGVFLARGVLGVSLRPPQEAFTPLSEDLHPSLTTRERVALQTKPQACQSCHSTINALGFTLEHFDAVGRFREKDNSKAVDVTGAYQTRSGATVKFNGARQLAEFLVGSSEVHDAFTQQLFHHLAKQPVRAYGSSTLLDLRLSFAENGFSIRKLMAAIATRAALKSALPVSDASQKPR